jgi:hypothetical protein
MEKPSAGAISFIMMVGGKTLSLRQVSVITEKWNSQGGKG